MFVFTSFHLKPCSTVRNYSKSHKGLRWGEWGQEEITPDLLGTM